MQRRILTYGAVLWDIIDGIEYIGGAPFNVAAHAAKLGCKSSIITRIGNDDRGSKALDVMRELGVDTSFVQVDPVHDTGTAVVMLAGLGVPTFYLPRDTAYEYIDLGDDDMEKIRASGFDALCFGTLEQMNAVSRNSLHRLLECVRFKHVFYDVNIRLDFYPEDIIKKSLEHSTIVKMNDGELGLISELLYGKAVSEAEFAKRFMEDYHISVLCVTKGKDGCSVYKDNSSISFPEYVVKVEDTVGAGDAFSAAFLAHYLKSGDAFESSRLGNIMGAYVASRKSAIPEYTDEIRKLMGL